MRLFLTTVLIFVNSYAHAAEQEALSNIQLDPLVVTGTRSQKALSDTPVRTEVVTKEQLQNHNAKTVAEALKGIPNILLKPIHGKSGFEVWMQGLSSDRVKVLIDGLPVSATTGSSVDVTQISTVGVERIEIVKGATSALYGSSAMGGVVNVITDKSSLNSPSYAVSLETGSFGEDNPDEDAFSPAFRRLSATGVGRIGDWNGRLSADISDSDGFDATPENWSTQGARGERSTIGLNLVWNKTANSEYTFGLERYAEDLKSNLQDNVGGKSIDKIKFEDTSRVRLDATAKWDLDDSVLSASVIRETLDNTTFQDVVITPEKEQRRDAELAFNQVNFDWMVPISDNHTMSLGGQLFESSLDQTKELLNEVDPGSKRNSTDFYLQNDVFSGNWELLPGVRIQDDSDFGLHIAPKVNVRYDFDTNSEWETYLRAGVGAGYRVPNLKERHYLFDHSHLGYIVNGNNNLVPEESLSYQFGMGFENGQNQRYEVNFFLNNIKNMINTSFDAGSTASRQDNVQVFRYQNTEKARTHGAELSLQQQLSPYLFLQAGYTWMKSEDLKTGYSLTRRPEHQINLALEAELPDWDAQVSLLGRYQSSEYVDELSTMRSPSWSEFDIKLNKALGDQLTFFTGINNLADTQRDFTSGADFRPEIGRYIYLGFTYSG